MEKNSKIFIAGHSGLVGSAIVRELKKKGYTNVVGYRADLTNRYDTWNIFLKEQPEYVFGAAAHAGGIMEAITKPAEMLLDNLLIQSNITEACRAFDVKKFLNIGSSCIYPVDGEQPYKEEQLGTGKTDENWSYAVAKLAGIELCRAYHKQYGCNFMTIIPCNLYGINDNFGDNGHVIPMLMRKIHESITMVVWGNGEARREFLYIDDLAECAVMLMEQYDYEDLYDGVINVGNGDDVKIKDVAEMLGWYIRSGHFHLLYDSEAPQGITTKLMDSSRIRDLGWYPSIEFEEGIKKTYQWFKGEYEDSALNQSG